jgi:hypothetical protein
MNSVNRNKQKARDESYSPSKICEASVVVVRDNTKRLGLLCVIKEHRVLSSHCKYHPVWQCKHGLSVSQLEKQRTTPHCYCVLVTGGKVNGRPGRQVEICWFSVVPVRRCKYGEKRFAYNLLNGGKLCSLSTIEIFNYEQKILAYGKKKKCLPVEHATCENECSVTALITIGIFNNTRRHD